MACDKWGNMGGDKWANTGCDNGQNGECEAHERGEDRAMQCLERCRTQVEALGVHGTGIRAGDCH